MKLKKTVCAVLAAAMVIIPLFGCSSKNNENSPNQQTRGTSSGQNGFRQRTGSGTRSGSANGGTDSSSGEILGKVTSIVGNEVTLDLVKRSEDSSSSSGYTSTGENKTLLIPVGLTLSSGGQGAVPGGAMAGGNAAGYAAAGNSSGNTGARAQGGAQTGTGTAGGTQGNRASAYSRPTGAANAGNTARPNTGGTNTGSTTATVTKSGFSSITKGEILRISQKTVNGTLTVVRVSVVSK